MMTDIDKTLAERGARYGDFTVHAEIAQAMKKAMAGSRNWDKLASYQREGLEMICHKIARMLNGDPTYMDSVEDIISYAKLIANGMRTEGWPYQNWARDVEGAGGPDHFASMSGDGMAAQADVGSVLVGAGSIAAAPQPQPDADGWIPWGGGARPVDESAAVVVNFRGLEKRPSDKRTRRAGDFSWLHFGRHTDITEYKVIQP